MYSYPQFISKKTHLSNDGLLFHYTKTKNFFDILDTLKLRPSYFTNLNDLNELNIHNYHNLNILDKFEIIDIIHKKCSMISFTTSYEYLNFPQLGTNRPSMWAHYANNSDGVCIVLDEKKFIQKNKRIIDKYFGHLENVIYDFINATGDLVKKKSPIDTIKANYKKLFFTKHIDWISENEKRLLLVGLDPNKEMISIDGCIAFIALGNMFCNDSNNINTLLKKISMPNHICFHKFLPHSFAMMTYDYTGYQTTDASFLLTKNKLFKKATDPDIIAYYDWIDTQF